ncbi:transposase [Pseudomonas sp. B329]|nr:transposase [Pseudomonas sp. B329]
MEFPPSTERSSVLAKRYELSNEAWGVISGLFTETHGRGQPRLNDRLMLNGILWVLCPGAAWQE